MKKILILSLISILNWSCVQTPPTPTSMELQAFQRKEFTTSKEVAFGSVVSVFQDLGYIIKSADKDTGLISAASPSKTSYDFFFGNTKMSNTGVNAFVESIGEVTAIRLNFVEVNEASSGYGQKAKTDVPIYDQVVYQNAFEKISEAIFIREKAQGIK